MAERSCRRHGCRWDVVQLATPASTDVAKWVDAAIQALHPAVDERSQSAIALLDGLLAAGPS